ncbi:MAG: helix-turn-helix transcriptional regulator [Candidatus Melainabacteria bacterium]|nr:helix-turn-helix transcriptional regulator [Candidatus Melainabacteria bacterium]
MLRTEKEYQLAKKQLSRVNELLDGQRERFKTEGFSPEEIDNLVAPSLTFAKQSQEEVDFFEQISKGEIPPVSAFSSAGQLLVALRIAKGITQRDLANRLGVSEAIISRDERNEYHGVTMEKAQRIVDALGGRVEISLALSDLSEITVSQNDAVKSTTKRHPAVA